MQADNLVRMVNQIAQFFAREGAEQGAAKTALHLRRFWEPRMRRAIIAHLEAGGDGLSPLSRDAVELLAKEAAAA
jgi:formate dehydrogenase subunit delta